MRRGPWYQFGDRSQRLVLEQLEGAHGVGVIISPRDLAPHLTVEYATQYHEKGAHVLIDQQFYVPDSRIGKLAKYPISKYRDTVSELGKMSDSNLKGLAGELEKIHSEIGANGLIAPALVYEAGRPDIVALNARLFAAAKSAGENLGIPTYATVVLGRSVTGSDSTLNSAISQATALKADGWYYGFEFDEPRIPSNSTSVLRCCEAGLTLACSGKPVLHAYAGPMGLLSLGFGATGVAIGHNQNLWQFSRERWYPADGQGGGGDAPPRFFSSALWGTIVYSDELAPLPQALREKIVTHSPYSEEAVRTAPPYLPWSRWEANKHLVCIICETIGKFAKVDDARSNVKSAIDLLEGAIALHTEIEDEGITLADDTSAYQANWRNVLRSLLDKRSEDFDYLGLLEDSDSVG